MRSGAEDDLASGRAMHAFSVRMEVGVARKVDPMHVWRLLPVA
jgi:hypothetical protein